jgi:hypothetical protein
MAVRSHYSNLHVTLLYFSVIQKFIGMPFLFCLTVPQQFVMLVWNQSNYSVDGKKLSMYNMCSTVSVLVVQWNPVKKVLKIPRKSYVLRGRFLKRVILMKWENFGAFLSWLLRREIFLTRFFLSEFHYSKFCYRCVSSCHWICPTFPFFI